MLDVFEKLKKQVGKLPESPGVYFFISKSRQILYIGKATSLRTRVRSYFAPNLASKRSPLVEQMVLEAVRVDYRVTDSVLEALILEANLIRKHLPPHNTALKDQKSWNYVVITDEDFPQVLVMREGELTSQLIGAMYKFGPFTNSYELRDSLKIIRKIFPYRDAKCKALSGRPCFNRQIGLCPGTCMGEISKKDYAKTVRHIKLFFEGKKGAILKSLTADMKEKAKTKEFEEAERIKWQINSLQHIQDIALLRNSPRTVLGLEGPSLGTFRIEAYDVAHTSGTSVVGVMTVVENGEPNKNEYRKFKIKNDENNDVKSLRELIFRRLNHNEWRYPDLIVTDGGEQQMNAAKAELEKRGIIIPVVSVVKDERHKPREILGKFFPEKKKDILLANNEAHRFAVAFHRRRLRSRT